MSVPKPSRQWIPQRVGMAIVLLLAACAGSPLASAADSERIIVKNTRLVGRGTADQDTAVNILIINGRLTVVTKDKLVIEPGASVGLAAILAGRIPTADRAIAVVATGGNVDAATFCQCYRAAPPST